MELEEKRDRLLSHLLEQACLLAEELETLKKRLDSLEEAVSYTEFNLDSCMRAKDLECLEKKLDLLSFHTAKMESHFHSEIASLESEIRALSSGSSDYWSQLQALHREIRSLK